MWVDEYQASAERHWKSAERLRVAGVGSRCWGSNIYVVLAEVHEERARQIESSRERRGLEVLDRGRRPF